MRLKLQGPSGLPVELKRTRRKRTVGIAVEDRRLKIYAPKRVSLREIQEIIQNRALWIKRQIQLQATESAVPARLFVDGEKLPFLGHQYALRVQLSNKPSVEVNDDQIIVNLKFESGILPFDGSEFLANRASEVRDHLIDWYQTEAENLLIQNTERFADRLGVTPSAVTVRHYKSQWGSCSITGHTLL